MGDLVLKGATSGQITVTPTAIAGTNTLTLPARTGNIITSADSGTVTQAMLASNVAGNGPAAIITSSGSQSITSGSWVKLTPNTASVNRGSNYNTSTNTFTATVAGLYLTTAYCNFTMASNATITGLGVYVGGVQTFDTTLYITQASLTSINLAKIVSLNVGTTLEIYAYNNATTPAVNQVFWQIAQIGASV